MATMMTKTTTMTTAVAMTTTTTAVATTTATMADAVGGVATTASGSGRAAAAASLAAARCVVEARDNRQRDNQPGNKRQMGGEAPADKRQRGLDRPRLHVERRGRVKRTRGGGIDTTTSRQTRDNRGGDESNVNGNGDGASK